MTDSKVFTWLSRLGATRGPGFARATDRALRAYRIGRIAAPIAIRTTRNAPVLAWFPSQFGHGGSRTFARALDRELSLLADAPTEQRQQVELQRVLRRVRELHAFDAIDARSSISPNLNAASKDVRVLLIDERVAQGGSSLTVRQRRVIFRQLVTRALDSHPGAEFWLACSAEGRSGRWLSESAVDLLPASLRRLSDRFAVCPIIDAADHVYTVSAPEGMHALLADVPLHVHGAPYYAGWGLTDDARAFPERTARPTAAMLFEAVFIRLSTYLDPITHARGSLHTLLDCIDLQRSIARRYADLTHVAGVRFQWWKRHFATPFLNAGGGSLRWTDDPAAVLPTECAALWGARSADGMPDDVRPVRIEDGFLHSTGLGSDMSAPLSQVIDTRGIYFDPNRPSDLNHLLNHAVFNEAELSRAAALRARIVACGLTKYNLGRRRPAWRAPEGKVVVLVPGQVADDASIRLGTRGISTAEALLREVRALRPHAWIIYKPHPDVLSGNRQGLVDANSLADIVDTECDLISLIEVADEVHTLSSLSGFEALIRGKKVYTYGLPFYAGWGLTHDALAPLPARERTLTLDMLTAGVLLRYPLYWDWRLKLFTTPERVADELAPHAARPLRPVVEDRLRMLRKARRWTHNVLRHLMWRWRRNESTEIHGA